MLIYRFKVTCDEADDFLREIEIQPGQTFLDFHHILVDSSELLHCENASFFMTDKKYKKDREVSLKPLKRQVRKYDEDIDQVVTESVSLPVMKNEKLKDYIEDPHQKMIYEFQGRDTYILYLELFRIFRSDGLASYPQCVKRSGELPKFTAPPAPVFEMPKPPAPEVAKVPLPLLESVSRLDNIVENEEEMSVIEQELEELLAEADAVALDGIDLEEGNELEEPESGHEADHEENMEYLDDFEDIDNLDRRPSGYDHDPDDY